MSDLDQLAISRILGSTVQPFARAGFGGFSIVKSVGEMLACRPKPPARLSVEPSQDAKIVEAFQMTHKGFSLDRMLADPELNREFIAAVQRLGVDASPPSINRRLLRIRKSGALKVKTVKEEKRDLEPFLIPAELAFAQLNYRLDASYDDLLLDPAIGEAFDALAMKIGRFGTAVDYRLAALHLRKNIRSRRDNEGELISKYGRNDLTERWRPIGSIAKVGIDAVPEAEGIFALSEPNRFLFLTQHTNMRKGVDRFRDPALLSAIGNRFWTPSLESISLQFIGRDTAQGTTLRLLELKALEIYRPIFNLLPKKAA